MWSDPDKGVVEEDLDGNSVLEIDEARVPTLRSQQIAAIVQFTPVMAIATFALSSLILAFGSAGEFDPNILIWTCTVNAISCAGLLSHYRTRRKPTPRAATKRALRRTVLYAVLLGTLWGAMPLLVLPGAGDFVRMITFITIGGVLCTTGFILAVLPYAALGFLVPALLGAFIAAFQLPSPQETAAVHVLLFGYAVVCAAVNVRQARNFVSNFSRETTIREQRNIIGLLLKEFEENSSDWLWEFDQERKINRVSERFAEAVSSAGTIEGCDFVELIRTLVHKDDTAIDEIEAAIGLRQTFHDVIVQLESGGRDRWWRVTGKPAFSEAGAYMGYIGMTSDITAQKTAEHRIQYLAHNDTLTGLLNRTKFTEHLNHAVARLERYGSPFAVLYIDLDQFKAVNDSSGHLVGDRLLSDVSRRLCQVVRQNDIVARLGGDEFAIIMPENGNTEEIEALAERVIKHIGEPYEIDGEVVVIGVSVGIAIAPISGTRPDQILRNADLALYRAKEDGRGTYRVFEPRMDADQREKRVLENELRSALLEEQFELYYQPLVSARNSRAVGFEALLRWNHPIRGLVSPAEFIPIAEQSNLINEIGDWTVREACRVAAGWPNDLCVAVNISAKHFHAAQIIEVVQEALDESGLEPGRLEIEVTESLFLTSQDDIKNKLTELRAMGVSIALDDFGTGYSSLSYLMKYPFDKIKIDKSFITASSEDLVARDILKSIAALGSTLSMRVTAEGVESLDQVDFLQGIDCDVFQGYYFARPFDATGVSNYLLNETSDAMKSDGRAEEGETGSAGKAAGAA